MLMISLSKLAISNTCDIPQILAGMRHKPYLLGDYTGQGKSRFTMVLMENDIVINK